MNFLSKKKEDENKGKPQKLTEKKEASKKRKSDKSIKASAPKSMAPKIALRLLFRIFILFVLIRGITGMIRGPQITEKVTRIGNESPVISDSVKGFAIDFATEYFTWSLNNVNNRIERISKFTNDIDQDAGLKYYDVKGESRVLSAEIYNSTKIDDKHFDITTLVRREVTIEPAAADSNVNGTDSAQPMVTPTTTPVNSVIKKTYMVVPVTVTADGPLIQEYPRFVVEQQKGDKADESDEEIVTDNAVIAKGTELATSFLKTYFEGDVNQLKYFYADNISTPTKLVKSEFSLSKVQQVQIHKIDGSSDHTAYLRIEASILVNNDLGETFTNVWVLNTIEKEGKLYVISLGYPEQKETSLDQVSPTNVPGTLSPAPESQDNSSY